MWGTLLALGLCGVPVLAGCSTERGSEDDGYDPSDPVTRLTYDPASIHGRPCVPLASADAGMGDAAVVGADRDAGGDESDFTDTEAAALYEAFASVMRGRCAITRCHGRVPQVDVLPMSPQQCDLRQTLAGVPACEYAAMPLVTPGDPEQSWLWLKLTAAVGDDGIYLDFAPAADFEQDPDGVCAPIGFGMHMPPPGYSITASELDIVRRWIEMGAPGPNGRTD